MEIKKRLIKPVYQAIARAKVPILIVALVYFVSLSVGILMVHTKNDFSLSSRDNLVTSAQTGSILTQTDHLQQGLADFGGNLIAAGTDSALGLGIVTPFPTIIYRGWVGGIVSVDGDHQSRLTNLSSAAYYFSVVFLQLLGYSLAAGAGIQLAFSIFRARPKDAGFFWFKIPREALLDLLRIYIVIVPILLTASLWEFLSPWR